MTCVYDNSAEHDARFWTSTTETAVRKIKTTQIQKVLFVDPVKHFRNVQRCDNDKRLNAFSRQKRLLQNKKKNK